MARYNEILVGRYNRFMQKLFAMKGGPVAPQLASEIAPAFPLFSGAENRYLEGWDEFGIFLTQAAVAAIFSGVKFRNPPGSNVMVVFEKIAVTPGGLTADAFTLQQGTNQTDGGTVVALTAINRDLRGRAQSGMIASTSGAAGLASMVGRAVVSLGVNTNYDFIIQENQEITLLPGGSIQLVNSTANQQQSSSWWWRERFLEDSERT
jgi:hypothetical protein